MSQREALHVVPLGDQHQHDTSSGPLCPCMPFCVTSDGQRAVVLHTAYDRREVGELCRLAMGLLGAALGQHGHVWTTTERHAYDHAMHVLSIGWPPKASERVRA